MGAFQGSCIVALVVTTPSLLRQPPELGVGFALVPEPQTALHSTYALAVSKSVHVMIMVGLTFGHEPVSFRSELSNLRVRVL